MDTNSLEKAGSTPATDELLTIVKAMQAQLSAQHEEFDHKVAQLETEVAHLRQQVPLDRAAAASSDRTTSRRRMLRKLVAGAAGVAALGVAANANQAQAATGLGNLDFNGTGGTPAATNAATGTTTIITAGVGFNNPVPLLTVNNTFNTSGSGTNPDNLSIGILGKSATSFGVYGINTGGGTAPTGVIGVSGNNGVLTDPFFANGFGGVVGSSFANSGTVGLSQSKTGAEGRSLIAEGVKGISQSGIGGAFGNDSTDPNVGAALRLGLRNSLSAPGPSSSHNAGEVVMDAEGRMYVCQAGNIVPGPVAPSATNPGFPNGLYNFNGSNWRFMAPMVVKSGPPPTPFVSTGNGDTDLHAEGELWLDRSTGVMYVNTLVGSTNSTMLQGLGIVGGQLPTFKPAGGPSIKFLPAPGTLIDTRLGIGGPTGAFTVQSWNLAAITSGVNAIPSNAKAFFGSITVFGAVAYVNLLEINGFIQIYPKGSPSNYVGHTYSSNVYTATTFFQTSLDATTSFTVSIGFGTTQPININISGLGYVA